MKFFLKKLPFFLLICLAPFLIGCSLSPEKAIATADQFYQYLDAGEIDSIIPLLDGQWFQGTSKTETENFLTKIKENFGKLEKCEKSSGFDIAADSDKTTVTLYYQCIWENIATEDIIILVKNSDSDQYLIASYEYKTKAMITADQFYEYLKAGDFDSIITMLDEKWLENTDAEQTKNSFVKLKQEMGAMNECHYIGSSKRQNIDEGTAVVLYYSCDWSLAGKVEDNLTLLKEIGQDYYQIVNYNFDLVEE